MYSGVDTSTTGSGQARMVDTAGGRGETRIAAEERKLKEQFMAAHGHS